MKDGAHIKITKACGVPSPLFPTPDMAGYIAGKDNGNVSLPADYTIKGHLIGDVQIGKSTIVARYERNGVKVGGLLTTSIVKKIINNTFETENSVYIVEELD